jgi:hypothetical protein
VSEQHKMVYVEPIAIVRFLVKFIIMQLVSNGIVVEGEMFVPSIKLSYLHVLVTVIIPVILPFSLMRTHVSLASIQHMHHASLL